MRVIHRKRFVKLKNSRNYHSKFGDLNSRKIISLLKIIKEIVELVLFIIQVLGSMLGTVFRIRIDVATHR